ncbi:MAG: hypothetical protein JWN76_3677 [Chitinophagaceae bacterium]|nr:hypothetical protein [Chitinophagaceae bacterium]
MRNANRVSLNKRWPVVFLYFFIKKLNELFIQEKNLSDSLLKVFDQVVRIFNANA